MLTGCQKEKDFVTLKAVINQDTKAYIGSINGAYYPFWNIGDRVRVNGVEYTLSQINQTYATIADVEAATTYYAVFPSSIVRTMNVSTGAATITVPTTQSYKKDTEGHQRVDMPMSASTTGNVLQFKNLCSIVKVNVSNNIPQNLSDNTSNPDYGDLEVERIVLETDHSFPISGLGTVDIEEGTLTMSGYVSNVILTGEYNNAMETIAPGDDHDFYIVVPPFSGTITMSVETTTGKHYKVSVAGATATASHMASITLTVDRLVGGGDAYLDEGPTVNTVLRSLATDNVTNIVFWYTMPLPAGYTVGVDAFRVDLQRQGDIPIYALLSAVNPLTGKRNLVFCTEASHIYANANSSYLFANLNKISQISAFSSDFITDNVTDMSYMFANNNTLSGLNGIETFNTTHVTTMYRMFYHNTKVGGLDLSHFYTSGLIPTGMVGMFDGCSNLQSLDLSSFHTGQITSMENLFNGCVRLGTLEINNFDMSGVNNKTDMCTGLGEGNGSDIPPHTSNNPVNVWCPSAVQTAMSSETGLNTAIISWHNTIMQ